MLYLKTFTFNPFQQNSYLIYDDEGTAYLFDAGNSNASENEILRKFIENKKLNLKRFILTHAHIDHILGARFILDTYGLLPEMHEKEIFFIERMAQSGAMYGISVDQAPMPKTFIKEGDKITLGKYEFDCLFTPGHSPGSISFYNKENKLLISGDVLFYGSIGRSDLPMGDHETLIASIKNKLLVLDDDVKVYSGHGPATTIGFERLNNPFLV
ncbi:MBL fold metallo-hydrolase [Aurantibacillus circumpalustris]|uniref:MBL fold metallo-hydrolase n=1 Tax=Aurantibacillus circumpalustris TaxID=3036359 RepID=UPI00295B4E11|nr:MBL fold metallo-hydrolase [Aurantibacillus circumpalustris]